MTSRRLLLGLVVVSSIAVGLSWPKVRGRLSGSLSDAAVRRQIAHICEFRSRGLVSDDLLCQKAVPSIPAFSEHYTRLKEEDGAWYAQRGWAHYPTVDCSGVEPLFTLAEQNFRCQGAEPVSVPD